MDLPIITATKMNLDYAQRPAARGDGQSATAVRVGRDALPDSATGALPPVQDKGNAKKDGSVSGRPADTGECQTCNSRKYQDGSDDPGVSFKNATEIDPDVAASAVRGHEMEHVVREQFKAAQQGRKVISQSVTMHSAICPECGRSYVSGGTTRTVTKGADQARMFQVGLPDENESGKKLSATA